MPADELAEARQAPIRELTLMDDGAPTTLKALVRNPQRVDLRFGMDENGELYLLTKQDAGVRALRPAARSPVAGDALSLQRPTAPRP